MIEIINVYGTWLPTKSTTLSLEGELKNLLQKYVGRPINDQIQHEIHQTIRAYTHVDYDLRFGVGNTINVEIKYDEEAYIDKVRQNRNKIIDELLDD